MVHEKERERMHNREGNRDMGVNHCNSCTSCRLVWLQFVSDSTVRLSVAMVSERNLPELTLRRWWRYSKRSRKGQIQCLGNTYSRWCYPRFWKNVEWFLGIGSGWMILLHDSVWDIVGSHTVANYQVVLCIPFRLWMFEQVIILLLANNMQTFFLEN